MAYSQTHLQSTARNQRRHYYLSNMKLILLLSIALLPLIESVSPPTEPRTSEQRVMPNGPKLAIKTIKASGRQRSDLYEVYQISPYRYVSNKHKTKMLSEA